MSVVVPAHNEARVIARLLLQLVPPARPGELEVIVVANGCTDDTAEIAGRFGPAVRVLTTGVASKREALTMGNLAARSFPRVYIDADVEIGIDGLRALRAGLAKPGVLAAAPERVLAMTGRPWSVRWYYDVWSRLPEVRSGLFGRGVIAVGAAGQARIASLPPVLADDLAASLVFSPEERAIVAAARVVVHPPRTFRDLLRRRVRAVEGVSQIEQTPGAPDSSARTGFKDLLALVRSQPRIAPGIAIFLTVGLAARLWAHRRMRNGNNSSWLRDESSRG